MGAKKQLTMAVKDFKATLLIAIALTMGYLWLSQGSLFVDKNTLVSLAFSLNQPLNIMSYMLTHMSLWHLAVNVFSLLLFASIVESNLGPGDVLGIFLFSGMTTVALFVLINPGTTLMGASAGVWGLMSSAFVLDARKAFASLGILLALFLLVFPATTVAIEAYREGLNQKNLEYGEQLREAVSSGKEKAIAEASEKKKVVEKEVREFSESKQFASEAEVDPFLHTYAGIMGLAFLAIFRRKRTIEAMKKQKIPLF